MAELLDPNEFTLSFEPKAPDAPPTDPTANIATPEQIEFQARQVDMGAARNKLLTGEQLSQAELLALEQFNPQEAIAQQAAPAIGGIGQFLEQPATQLGLAAIAPGAGTAALGAAGARFLPSLLGVGTFTGRLAGATAGSVGGTAFNQAVGLERPGALNLAISALTPVAGEAISAGIRGGAGVLRKARSARARRSQEIVSQFPTAQVEPIVQRTLNDSAIKLTSSDDLLDNLVKQKFDEARQLQSNVDLSGFVEQARGQVRPEGLNFLVQQVASVDRRIGQSLANAFNRQGAATVSASDLVAIRRTMQNAKNNAFTTTGTERTAALARAQDLDESLKILDDVIATQDINSPLRQANDLASAQFMRNELEDVLEGAAKPKQVGSDLVTEFNVAKVAQNLRDARRAFRRGKPSPLSTTIRLLEREGGPGAVDNTIKNLQTLANLAPEANIQLINSSSGAITRTAALAARNTATKALGELLMSAVGQDMLAASIKEGAGRLSLPILSSILSATRAATVGQVGVEESKVLGTIRQVLTPGAQPGAQPAQVNLP